MPVFQGSRYEDVPFSGITGRDLVTRKWLHPRDPITTEDVDQDWSLHTVAAGDVLDDLAYSYTNNNPRRSIDWWKIADVNNIMWPLDLEPGTDLMIPINFLHEGGI